MASLGAGLYLAAAWCAFFAAGLHHPPAAELWAEARQLLWEREALAAAEAAWRRRTARRLRELRRLLAPRPDPPAGPLAALQRNFRARRALAAVVRLREELLKDARRRLEAAARRDRWRRARAAHLRRSAWLGVAPVVPPLPDLRAAAREWAAALARENRRTRRLLRLLGEEAEARWRALADRIRPPPPLAPPPGGGEAQRLWRHLEAERERLLAVRRRYRRRLAAVRARLSAGDAEGAAVRQAAGELAALLAAAARHARALAAGTRRLRALTEAGRSGGAAAAAALPPLQLPPPVRALAALGLVLVGLLGGRALRGLALAAALFLLGASLRGRADVTGGLPPALAVLLLVGWRPWDLLAGLLVRMRPALRPGSRIRLGDAAARVLRRGLWAATLGMRDAEGALVERSVPYRRLLWARSLPPAPPPLRLRLHPRSDPAAAAALARAVVARCAGGAEGVTVSVRPEAEALTLEVALPDALEREGVAAALGRAVAAAPFLLLLP